MLLVVFPKDISAGLFVRIVGNQLHKSGSVKVMGFDPIQAAFGFRFPSGLMIDQASNSCLC
jgi:hypothetical protein